jgi:hypothetical protein
MKIKHKKKTIRFFIILSFVLNACVHQKQAEKNFKNQIGVYQLDTLRTELEGYDSIAEKLNDLYIEFKSDSTFQMSSQVPFFRDSIGRWESTDDVPYNHNYMGDNFEGELSDINSMQFINLYEDKGDSIFMIVLTQPKKGFKGLYRVYFKKLSNN